MKYILSPYTTYPLISAGILADKFHGVEWAGNLSLFALWALIVLSLLLLLLPSSELFKNDKSNLVKKILGLLCIVTQVAAGWIVTAIFFSLTWAAFQIKKSVHESELSTDR